MNEDTNMLNDLATMLRQARECAQEILGPGAFVSFTMTLGPQGELEPVWEVGVQTREHSRDLWGRQGSLEAALHEANTAKKSSSVVRTGGRR
jgi:hypothetical protein